jgi:hypothetical protein
MSRMNTTAAAAAAAGPLVEEAEGSFAASQIAAPPGGLAAAAAAAALFTHTEPGTKTEDVNVSSSSGSMGGSSSSRFLDDNLVAANLAASTGPSTPRRYKQPGVVVCDSLSYKSGSDSKEAGDVDQAAKPDVAKDTSGGCGPTTTWEIATQSVAAAVAYAKTVKADREAAGKRGEEPEKPLPFQFTWPGKPVEAVHALGLFTNLPVGGLTIPPPPTNSLSATFEGPPTALHVQVVLELLLLCWPDPQVPYVASDSANEEIFPVEFVVERRWDWLLLMSALLQQTSTEQKQHFMQERGPLFIQLLYQIMLEDKGMGGAGASELWTVIGDATWPAWYLAVSKDREVAGLLADAGMLQSSDSVLLVVTLVLQNLLFEALPESLVNPETARIGKVLKGPLRKYGTWASMAG